jgi:hypothetical protein
MLISVPLLNERSSRLPLPDLRVPSSAFRQILPACRARVLRLPGREPQLRWPPKILPACRVRVLRLPGQERGRLGAPIVASKPNDLAGKRPGFRSRSTGGRAICPQGLTATCKDPPEYVNEAGRRNLVCRARRFRDWARYRVGAPGLLSGRKRTSKLVSTEL